MKKDIKIYIDLVDNDSVQGWFINSAHPEKNKILLYLDGLYQAVTLANIARQDVADAHGQLHSGFYFDITKYPKFRHLELKSETKEPLFSLKNKKEKKSTKKKQSVDLISAYSLERYQDLEKINIELNKPINGDNWYSIEPTGRWGGPELESTLKIPALGAGNYKIKLSINSDFCGLEKMQLLLNDNVVKFSNTDYQSPVILEAEVQVEKQLPFWHLSLNYPKTVTPDGASGADQRKLGVFLKTVSLTKITSSHSTAI